MCGRFTLTTQDVASLAKQWAAEVEEALSAGWRPRFNVAPGDPHPVLVAAPGAAGRRRLISARFGWRSGGDAGLLINARAETAATLPTFREAFRARRAAVPADGFFEWEGPPSARRPTWFHDGGRTLWLAALLSSSPILEPSSSVAGPERGAGTGGFVSSSPIFERRSSSAGPERGGGTGGAASGLPSEIAFVILTTEARAPVQALHDRMPLLVPPALLAAWLQGPPPALPAPADGGLSSRRVSDRVNSVRNDDASCLEPARPPAQGRLF